jgi:outer membrane protein, adhesin transport system
VVVATPSIPPPSGAPQLIRADTDPFLLSLAARQPSPVFVEQLGLAAEALPTLGERAADVAAADAIRNQNRSRLFPTLGVDGIALRTITRDFELSTTQVENLSPLRRNDVTGSVEQLVTDFGASSARIRAANAAADAARADLDAARNEAILQLVTAWYAVLSARTSLSLASATVVRLSELADGAVLRFERGVDSGGDVARARSYLAAAESQKVSFSRRLANAEARYRELFGNPPQLMYRPTQPAMVDMAGERPEVVAARAEARAAAAAVDAARSDRLPRLDARVGATAFDILNGKQPDYDVRAQLTLRQRFSTGGAEAARVAELKARQRSASLAVDRVGAATERERVGAEADVAGLAGSIIPLESAYIESRKARDLFVEQFRVSRGTLFDVLRAESDLRDAALALAQANYEYDIAVFALLSRKGGLIEYFGLTPAVTNSAKAPQEGVTP